MAVAPGATVALLQATGEALGQVQVPPPLFTTASETKVVFAGKASLNVAVLQLLGPELVITCVYVILLPAVAGFGVPLLVTARSHSGVTLVTTVVLLLVALGSPVVGGDRRVRGDVCHNY